MSRDAGWDKTLPTGASDTFETSALASVEEDEETPPNGDDAPPAAARPEPKQPTATTEAHPTAMIFATKLVFFL